VPLVNHPRESVATFLDTDIDMLAIGSYLVSRP
jgi:predicted NodU family carbamoyl transferase